MMSKFNETEMAQPKPKSEIMGLKDAYKDYYRPA